MKQCTGWEALIKHIWRGIYIYFVLFPSSALPILVLQVPEGQEAFIKPLLSCRSWILWQTQEREGATHIDDNKNGKCHPRYYLFLLCKAAREKKWEIAQPWDLRGSWEGMCNTILGSTWYSSSRTNHSFSQSPNKTGDHFVFLHRVLSAMTLLVGFPVLLFLLYSCFSKIFIIEKLESLLPPPNKIIKWGVGVRRKNNVISQSPLWKFWSLSISPSLCF